MAGYRFVFLNLSGAALSGKLNDSKDDLAALDIAAAISTRHGVDMHRHGRHVAVVRSDESLVSAQEQPRLFRRR